jgi:hypothetical protein
MNRFPQPSAALAAGVLALCAGSPAGAAEFRAVLGGWGYHITGTTVANGQPYDLKDDLELHGSRRRSALVEFDTPRGWWPDIAASYSQLGATGSQSGTFAVGPLPPTSRTIRASGRFDDLDLTLRYPWRWAGLRFSAGVMAKRLNGDIDIDDSAQAQPSHQSYDEILPLLQAGVRWRVGSMLTLAAQGQGIESGGNRALEWRTSAEIRVMEPLLVEFGWQQKRYDIDVGNYALDAAVKGMLLRIGFLYR